MIASKCLYIDMDVKKDAYLSTADAKRALLKFVKDTNFLIPNMIVESGTGGLHVYWTLEELICHDDFNMLSSALVQMAKRQGLIFDGQCTNDCVRVLRPPGTFNFKTGKPLPVKLMHIASDYKFAELYDRLMPFVTSYTKADDDDNLRGGMQKTQFALSNIDTVAEACPFVKATIDSGGTSYGNSNVLWTYTIMLAGYCEDAQNTAIRFCHKHPAYRQQDILDKLDYHIKERQASPTAGPPKCASFQKEGAKECTTCPHKDLGRSPLNVPGAIKPIWNTKQVIPSGYYLHPKNQHVIKVTTKEVKGVETNEEIEVFPYPILGTPWVSNYGGDYYLYFDTIESTNKKITIDLAFTSTTDDQAFRIALAKFGIVLPFYKKETREFFMSFQKMLRSQIGGVVRTEPIGWELKDGTFYSFSYDGKAFSKNGVGNAPKLKGGIGEAYTPMGDVKPWLELSTIISDQKRPALDVILISAFAAPLVPMTGHSGIILGAYSSKTGIGKTTAMTTATAVWGHPTKGRNGLNDTINMVMNKAGQIRNLPLIWDELKTQKQFSTVSDLVFQLTEGREKGRLNRQSEVKDIRDFQTLLIYAANSSIVEHITKETKGTAAGVVRIFEFEVPPIKFEDHAMAHVQNLQGQLQANFGIIGLAYAKYLGEHGKEIHDKVVQVQTILEKQFNVRSDERFWIAAITALFVASKIANEQGWTNIDLSRLRDFLYKEFERMRHKKNVSPLDYSQEDAIVKLLSEFISVCRARNTLRINQIRVSPGRPPKGSVTVTTDPMKERMLEEIKLVIGDRPKTIRFPDRAWGKFCGEQSIPTSSTRPGLVAIGGRSGSAILTGGTKYQSGIEPCWTILIEGTDLEKYFDL